MPSASPPASIRVVGAAELRAALTAADLIEPMRRAFRDYSSGLSTIGVSILPLPGGDAHVKSASSESTSIFAVKVASLVAGDTGRPVASGAFIVCSATTGRPLALLEDDHYLTDIRTAAAGALATDLFSRSDAHTVGIIGTGLQAHAQVATVAKLRQVSTVAVWGRRATAAAALAERVQREMGVRAEAAATPQAVVGEAEIVITATAADQPVVRGEWLSPGQHVTALGADDAYKREIDSACLRRADRIFVDSREQTMRLAEIAAALAEDEIRADDVAGEIGEVLTGAVDGRRTPDEITLVKLTGIGTQDVVAAEVALERIAPELLV